MGLFGKKKQEATSTVDSCEALARQLDEVRETHQPDGGWPWFIALDGRPVGLASAPLAFWQDSDTDCEYGVVGESHYMPWLKQIQAIAEPGDSELRVMAVLVRDQANEFDPNAVAVTMAGRRVGYLPAADSTKIAGLFAQLGEIGVQGIVVEASVGWGADRNRIGVRLDISPSVSEPGVVLAVAPAV